MRKYEIQSQWHWLAKTMYASISTYGQLRFPTCYCSCVAGATAYGPDFTWWSDIQQSWKRLDRYENLFIFLSLLWLFSWRYAVILTWCSCSVQLRLQFILLTTTWVITVVSQSCRETVLEIYRIWNDITINSFHTRCPKSNSSTFQNFQGAFSSFSSTLQLW